jgi:CHAD domain-containing protein
VLSPDDGVGLAARSVLRIHLRTFAREEGGARACEAEPVHQLRVATRRLRAALRLFGPELPRTFVEAAERELAWLGGSVGALRDADVLATRIEAEAARLDPVTRHALGPLALALHERRRHAHAALVAALDSARCRRLLDRLAAFADSAPPRSQRRLGDVVARLVRPLQRAVLRAGRRAGPRTPAPALHRLRVRTKRLRYALEILIGLGGEPVRKLLRRLVRLQDVLGESQDAVTQVAWLRAHAETATLPPATLVAMGVLVHALLRRERKARRRLREVWARLERRHLLAGAAAGLTGTADRAAGGGA